MPGPAPTAGRDDVLASIRRLVLEQSAPGGPGRLVLTPALRVSSEDAPAQGTGPSREPPGEPAEDLSEPEASGLLARAVAEAVAEVLMGPPEGGSAVPPPSGDRPAEGPTDPQAPETRDRPEGEGPDSVPPPLLLTPSVAAPAAGRAQEIEAAVAGRPEAWEPDGSEEPDHWSLAEVPPEPVFRHRLLAEEAPPPPIDEDRLRALVAEVLRAELQGELGERMTRNIRRLVRREIFRVLETREE